ncbi:MAG: hypothetical protein PHQ12_00005, partial [Chthoniobacteraceae bacterium]|nr:hypothetical protein [Chthoniobacteraceae bacterium]
TTPKLVFLTEQAEVRAKIRHQGFPGKTVTASLSANGKVVDEQKITLPAQDGESEVTFRFVPQEMGELKLEASIPVLPEEISKENNTATDKLRVIDSKVHVLVIEQEPRWDFRYLISYLQRDRRLEVRCALIDGEPGLDKIKDSPFLPSLPDDRETFFKSEILILGDVNPSALGTTRMKIIHDWVEQAGGGIIFHAGSKFNPTSYAGTPLEPLLPVIPDTSLPAEQYGKRSLDYFPLKRSPMGENSPYLKMAENPADNQRIWNGFPGVRWTASVSRAKPGAEVLLVDPRPDHASRDGARPVFAIQGYGAGTSVYIGTDETYRWYSHKGEAYYSIFWGQIMESLSLQRLQGASSLTQLKTDRQKYFVGDKVIVSGRVFQQGFKPLIAPALQGNAKILASSGAGRGEEKQVPVTLSPVEGQKGEYRGEFTVNTPGEYRFATTLDPNAVLKFDVTEPNLEKLQTSLDEQALKSMAQAARSRLFREEDLDGIPNLVASKSVTLPIFKKIELYYSPWWLAALAAFASLEWILRRMTHLK